jgi:N-acetylmuramoyl-L-alanine amidase
MPQQYKEMLLTPGQGGRPGWKIEPKALAIHWTANTNKGADAVANRNYFENHPQNKVSAHYVVDARQVVKCVPEDEMAYHVGANQYTQRALKELGSYPNAYAIGIEMCVNSDGNFRQTYQNTVKLAAEILRRHGWGTGRLWRHYDVTGKDCPRYFVNDAAARSYGFENEATGWDKFRRDVELELKTLEMAEGAESVFKDIVGHWAQGNIEHLAEIGVVSGKGGGTFDPNSPITRAEAAVIVDLALAYVLEEVKKMIKEAA